MQSIQYQEIDHALEEKIAQKFGAYVSEGNYIHRGDGCLSLAAVCNGEPVGFISTFKLRLPPPLNAYEGAYIDVLEVDAAFRRQGISSEMIHRTEQWAKAYGYRQIRAWSSEDKVEAIPMWYALDYCVCPTLLAHPTHRTVPGVYVSKMLNPQNVME